MKRNVSGKSSKALRSITPLVNICTMKLGLKSSRIQLAYDSEFRVGTC